MELLKIIRSLELPLPFTAHFVNLNSAELLVGLPWYLVYLCIRAFPYKLFVLNLRGIVGFAFVRAHDK
jgi:hypothetical protein